MTDDLRSHALGQKVREMSDDVDSNAGSLLDAQERAAKPTDREWMRLRLVDRLARELILAPSEERERLLGELAEALWPS